MKLTLFIAINCRLYYSLLSRIYRTHSTHSKNCSVGRIYASFSVSADQNFRPFFCSLVFLLCRFFCILIRLHLDLLEHFFLLLLFTFFYWRFLSFSFRFSWPDSMHALRRLTRRSDVFIFSFRLNWHFTLKATACVRVSGFVCVSDEPVDFKVKVVAWKISLWYE